MSDLHIEFGSMVNLSLANETEVLIYMVEDVGTVKARITEHLSTYDDWLHIIDALGSMHSFQRDAIVQIDVSSRALVPLLPGMGTWLAVQTGDLNAEDFDPDDDEDEDDDGGGASAPSPIWPNGPKDRSGAKSLTEVD